MKRYIDEPEQFFADVGKGLLATPIALAVFLYSLVANAVCLKWLWQWFLVDHKPISGINAIGYAEALGLAMVFVAIHPKTTANKEDKMNWFIFWFSPPFRLLLGYIVSRYCMGWN